MPAREALRIAAAAWLPLFLGGQGLAGAKDSETFESVTAKMLGQLEKAAETLKAVKDADGAIAARKAVKENIIVFFKLRALSREFPPPPREVRDRLALEYRKKFEKVQEELKLQIARIRGSAAIIGGREAVTEIAALLYGKDKELEIQLEKEAKEKDSEKD